ncbi:MAG: hypothetical protein DIU71_04900 [Proteobacteria bacterium]|nr:MAG: hypothetical protein DIU71_04900 [Pseudomonadota bacterium]
MQNPSALKLSDVRPDTEYIGVRCKKCRRSIYVAEAYPLGGRTFRAPAEASLHCERCGHRDRYRREEFGRCFTPPTAGGMFWP